MAVDVNTTVLLVVTPFSLVESYEIFKASATLKMEAAASSETLVALYRVKRCHIPENSNLPVNSTPEHVMRV
jgi:hypothetical protein